MKQNEDFLNPLKNRPGLKPRQEFKTDLAEKLRHMEKKERFPFLKVPLLIGVAIMLVFLIFSEDLFNQKEEGYQHSNSKQDSLDLNISENEAIETAKKLALDEDISWIAHFEKDPSVLHDELKSITNPVWEVVGTYPMGNKVIFYIDAKTAKILLSREQEAEGSIGSKDNFVEIKKEYTNIDQASHIFQGEVVLQVSEKGKTELKNGSSISVFLSGATSSVISEPIKVTDPKDEITIPFELQFADMTGTITMMVIIKDEQDVVVSEIIVKTFTFE